MATVTMRKRITAWLTSWDFGSFRNQGKGYLSLLVASDPELFDYFLLVVGLIAAIAAGVPFPLLGILFGQLVDSINSTSCSTSTSSSTSISDSVREKVLMVIYITIANFALIYIHSGCWSLLGERLVRRLRNRYLQALLEQELAFFDKLPAGEVASRLDADLQVIQTGTSEKVGICIASVSYFVASYVVAFIKSPVLAGILVSLLPAYLIMGFVGGHFAKKYTTAMADHVAAATAVASGGLSNMVLVHAFNANARLEAVFADHLSKAKIQGMKKAVTSAIQMGCLYFIAYSANAVAFWQGSRQIADSVAKNGTNSTVGAVYTVIFLLIDASFIISQVAPFLQLFSSAASAFTKLAALIDRKSEIDPSSPDGHQVTTVEQGLEFRDVHFSYPSRPETEVLRGISFSIPAKLHTAIVGLSGSGKSTIAALTERLYDPTAGDIYLDGYSLREINVKSLRGLIGTVEQNSNLLDRSILENIAYGLVSSPQAGHAELQKVILDSSLPDLIENINSGKTMDEALAAASPEVRQVVAMCRDAATQADAIKFIDHLQHGLATSVGSSGDQLSGGQKQRIVLARALIRNPSILLLDEATAALDSTSERKIQAALDKVSENRTTITIAHRLSTIKNAHNVIVMRAGQIIEQGTYADLLAKGGELAGMIRLQTLRTSDPNRSASSSTSNSIITMTNESKTTLETPVDEKEDKEGLEVSSESTPSNSPKDEEHGRTRTSTLKTVFGMGRPYLFLIFLGIAGSIIVGGSYSGEAVIFGHTVGSLSPCRGASAIRASGNLYGGLFFALACLEFIANVISTSAYGRVAENLLYTVRVKSLHSLFHQDIQWHESEGRTPGTLLSYISSDANSLSGITGTILGVMLSTIVSLIAGIILSHVVAWRISIVLLATVPVLLASGFLRLKVLAQFHERHQKAFANSVSIATEAVQQVKTIAVFSLQNTVFQTFDRSLQAPYVATMKKILFGNFWLALAYSISNLIYALAYYWGTRNVSEGRYSQTQFFMVLPALLFSAQGCGQMFSLAPDVSKATVAAGRVIDLLDIAPEESKSGKEGSTSEKDPEIAMGSVTKPTPGSNSGLAARFRQVRFSYPARPDIEVLKGLDITFEANKFSALVGPSGAGKSTVISLLERFYTPTYGSVEIDGRDISKMIGTSFRDEIALVPQSSTLFDGTVRFNLSIGARPGQEPTQEELEIACRQANMHDTIMSLPQGYDTSCGANGNQFSGGQLQRLSIARALLRKPRLLILDEPTSALDAESERLVQEALERITTNGLTVVAIAHRLQTIRKADRIFVIEEGHCVDQGTHEDLMSRSESYRTNALHQTLE